MTPLRFAASLLIALTAVAFLPAQDKRPNVLWIYVEDMNPWFGCDGHDVVETPVVDRLAKNGVRFSRCYMPAGVCSATRSAVITGAMQTTHGVHNHRSARANFRGQPMDPDYDAIRLPDGVRTVPELFRAAGYYTFNQGKTDYNFVHDVRDLYDRQNGQMNLGRIDLAKVWLRVKESGKPFFGQFQLRGGKNNAPKRVDRSSVSVPPYYPDVPLVREEIAYHYDCVRKTDREVGTILASLDAAGMRENTIVFFFTDHGFRMHRHKQFLYEGGIRVPCVVSGPGVSEGVARADLVSGIDLGPTALALAGIAFDASMEGRNVFADDYEPRRFVVAARDRCDYTIERIRALVTKRYKYLRNYLTDRPYMQPHYRDPWPVTQEMRRMAAAGELNATQLAFYGADRPAEELYDLDADPHEVRNLVADPAHADALREHREVLAGWIRETGDQGQRTESAAGLRAALRRWGDKCVNPEYEPVRTAMLREDASKSQVLILGDSISMGYGPTVRKALWSDAIVTRPRENCQGTTHGIARVDAWLAMAPAKWDVIWFNFGLHDLKRVHPKTRRNSNDPDHPRQAEPETYRKQLREIAQRLTATGARLVFCTTTPVPEGVRPRRDVTDPDRYNAIAKEVMREFDIEVFDLCEFATARLAEIQRPRDVHFSREGSAVLGRAVAKRIRAVLPKR